MLSRWVLYHPGKKGDRRYVGFRQIKHYPLKYGLVDINRACQFYKRSNAKATKKYMLWHPPLCLVTKLRIQQLTIRQVVITIKLKHKQVKHGRSKKR